MWSNPQFPVHLVTFTEETLNEKLHFCAVFANDCRLALALPKLKAYVLYTSVSFVLDW